jgi:hypothetical protein
MSFPRTKSDFEWIFFISLTLIFVRAAFAETDKDPKKTRDWGPEIEGQAISIRCDKDKYVPEEKVRLFITQGNVGKEIVYWADTLNVFYSYRFSVKSSDGKEANLTKFGQLHEGNRRGGSQVSGPLDPGKEIVNELPLSRYFDFSVTDKYTIVVQKRIFSKKDRTKFETLTSNKIERTVEEPVLRK